MVDSLGPKWSEIVKNLPGRTVASVRNRYQRIQKGQELLAAGVDVGMIDRFAQNLPPRARTRRRARRGGR